jgi:predicted lipoprotein with Yx(FWY)xxD motif
MAGNLARGSCSVADLGQCVRAQPLKRRGMLVQVVPVAIVVTLLAACGGATKASQDYKIGVRTIAGLGRVLVDGSGRTLYMYGPDHRGRSVCYSVCAKQWPPLLLPPGVGHALAGHHVDAALLGTVIRREGSAQVTYNGWPLYLYYGDDQPGQATGQADDMGLWYVLSPSGAVDRRPLPDQSAS